jgi:hypothetical protein
LVVPLQVAVAQEHAPSLPLFRVVESWMHAPFVASSGAFPPFLDATAALRPRLEYGSASKDRKSHEPSRLPTERHGRFHHRLRIVATHSVGAIR